LSDQHHHAVEATVTAELPQRLFRLETTDGNQIVAGPSEEAKRLGVQIRTGQRVLVREASLDPGRGVIIGLLEHPHRAQGSDESKN
jgi:translation initiation factor IF-1